MVYNTRTKVWFGIVIIINRKICFWHIHTIFGTWVYHYGTMCHIHSWTLSVLDFWPQYQNDIFTVNLSGQDCLCSLTQLYQIWHMGISPRDKVLFTFMTSVWPWPLTYIWVAGVSLVIFTYSFYLVHINTRINTALGFFLITLIYKMTLIQNPNLITRYMRPQQSLSSVSDIYISHMIPL